MAKNYNYRTDRPQDEIPEDIWIQNVLESYHKEHEELESLRSYAKGLEEENVELNKKLDKYLKEDRDNPEFFTMNKLLKEELERLKQIIETNYKVRVLKLSTYKKILQQQHQYLCRLEDLLDKNGIEYHKLAQQIIVDADSIDVTAVRKPSDLHKTNSLIEETDN